jgi:tellurite resistance protein
MREFAPETMAQLVEQLNNIPPGAATDTTAAKGSGADVNVKEALVEVAFLVAAVDGEVTALEVAQFGEAVEAAFGGADVNPKELLGAMAARLEAEGWDKRAKAVSRALAGTEHAERAYRLAVSVAFVDDDVAHAEAAGLDSLARGLGVGDDRTHEIMSELRKELFGD